MDEGEDLVDKYGSLKMSRISSISHSDPEIHTSPKLLSRIDHSILLPSVTSDQETKSQEIEPLSSSSLVPPTQRKIPEQYFRSHLPETLESQFKNLMEGVITRALEGEQGGVARNISEGLVGLNRLVVMLEQLNQARKDNRYWRKRCRYLENKFSCPGAIGTGSSGGMSPERAELKDVELKSEQMLKDYFSAKPLAKKKYSLSSELELKKMWKEKKIAEDETKQDKMERKKSKKFQTKWEQVKKVFSGARQEALAKKGMTADWVPSKTYDKHLGRTDRQRTIAGPLITTEAKKSAPEEEHEGEGNLDSPKSANSEPAVELATAEEGTREEPIKTEESKIRFGLNEFPNIDSFAESTAKLQDILNFQKQQQITINFPDVLQHEQGATCGSPKASTSSSHRNNGASDDQKQVQFIFPDQPPQRRSRKSPGYQDISPTFLAVKQDVDAGDHHLSDSDRYFASASQLGKFSKSDRGQLDQVWDSGQLRSSQQHYKLSGEDQKYRSGGRATWERVKDLIQTRKGSFKRRRSKKQRDSSLDLIPQASLDADADGKFPDVADVSKPADDKGETSRDTRSSRAVDSWNSFMKKDSSVKREFSGRFKKWDTKIMKDDPTSGTSCQRKISRSEETFKKGLPKSDSSPGLTELTPILSRSRSDKIRRDRSTSNEGGGVRGVVSSLTSPMRRKTDTTSEKGADKKPLSRAQPLTLKDQKRRSGSKRFSSRESTDDQSSFDAPSKTSKAPPTGTISLAEIYTCTSLSSTFNVVSLSSSYRPPPSSLPRKDHPKDDLPTDLASDLNEVTSDPDVSITPWDNTQKEPHPSSLISATQPNLRVPTLHLAVSAESLQSASSSGYTRGSSILSSNTPCISPSFQDDSKLLCLTASMESSSLAIAKDDKTAFHASVKERPKSTQIDSFGGPSFSSPREDLSSNVESPVGGKLESQDPHATDILNHRISSGKVSTHVKISPGLENTSHSTAETDKAALLSRLVSASEILFRSIETPPSETSKHVYSRKSFLLLKELMERLISELKSKNGDHEETHPTQRSPQGWKDEPSTERNHVPCRGLLCSETQTTPTIERSLSTEGSKLDQEKDESSFEEDFRLMSQIQTIIRNLSKTRRLSDSVITSPKLFLQFPSNAQPSRSNLTSDPTPMKFHSESEAKQSHVATRDIQASSHPLRSMRQTPTSRLHSQYDNVFPNSSQSRPHSSTQVEESFFQLLQSKQSSDFNDSEVQSIGIQITKSSERNLSTKEFSDKNGKFQIEHGTTLDPFQIIGHRTLSDSGISESVYYSRGSSRNQSSHQVSTDPLPADASLSAGSLSARPGRRFLLPPVHPTTRKPVSAKPPYEHLPRLTIYTRTSTVPLTSESFVVVRKLKTAAELMAVHSATSGSQFTDALTPPSVRCSYEVPHKNGRSKSHDYGRSLPPIRPEVSVVSSDKDDSSVPIDSVKKLGHVSSTPYIFGSSMVRADVPLLKKEGSGEGTPCSCLATLSEPLIYVDPCDGINTKVTLPSIYALTDLHVLNQTKGASISGVMKPSSASDPLNHKSTNLPDTSLISINSSDFFETSPLPETSLKNVFNYENVEPSPKVHRPTASDSEVLRRHEYPIDVVTLEVNPIKPSHGQEVRSSSVSEQAQTKKHRKIFSICKKEKTEEQSRISLREKFLASPKFLRIKFNKCKTGARDSVAEEEPGDPGPSGEPRKTQARSRSLPRSTTGNIFSRFFDREFFQRSRRFFRRNKK